MHVLYKIHINYKNKRKWRSLVLISEILWRQALPLTPIVMPEIILSVGRWKHLYVSVYQIFLSLQPLSGVACLHNRDKSLLWVCNDTKWLTWQDICRFCTLSDSSIPSLALQWGLMEASCLNRVSLLTLRKLFSN